MDERTFDYADLLNELRCRPPEWLAQRRDWLVREQRRLHVEELAVLRVLDERAQIDDATAQVDGTRLRDLHRKRRTAERLEAQPYLAEAAANGDLSAEQLDRLSDLADGDPEAERRWATEGAAWSPDALAAELRRQRTPTVEDAAARRAARELRFWWRHDHGMLDGRFSLPDIDGALFESVINDLVEKMRPTKGHPWETRERRGADALMELVRSHAGRRADDTCTAPGVHMIVQVPLTGPAQIAGIDLPDAMVERLRASARIEPVLTRDDGEPLVVGRTESTLSEKTRRVVRQRDGQCRWPGCDHRIGLAVHHLWPRSWGGTDHIHNLATICATHHAQLAPQGQLLLLGIPNNPAGLTLIDRDDLPHLATLAADHARAGPQAA